MTKGLNTEEEENQRPSVHCWQCPRCADIALGISPPEKCNGCGAESIVWIDLGED